MRLILYYIITEYNTVNSKKKSTPHARQMMSDMMTIIHLAMLNLKKNFLGFPKARMPPNICKRAYV